MVHGIQRIFSNPFYLMKKHKCPKCCGDLKKITIKKVVNSKSKEAEFFDFSTGSADTYLCGNIRFIWDELKCDLCGFQIKPKELKKLERRRNSKYKTNE